MTDATAWSIVALLMVPIVFQVALSYAPKSFWRTLGAKNETLAHMLWGFSHPFGPLSRPDEPPAWERLRR